MGKAQEVNLNIKEIDARQLKLKDLELSGYTVNPLVKRGIETLGDVASKPKEYYEGFKNYRQNSVVELEKVLKKYGLDSLHTNFLVFL